MAIKKGKGVLLGKGLRLDIDKKQITVQNQNRNLRITLNPRGIQATAGIPKTDLKYSQSFTFQRGSKNRPALQVTSEPSAIELFNHIDSKGMKAPSPVLLRFLGIVGIVAIFLSYRFSILFFIGALCILLTALWRKKADPMADLIKTARGLYQRKKYTECIQRLDEALTYPNANRTLLLIKADCQLNLDNASMAYSTYREYFKLHDGPQFFHSAYWGPALNGIFLALNNKDYDFALNLCESLEGFKEEIQDMALWRGYLKGLAFMGMERLEAAIEAFKDALGKKRSMDHPYVDIHYQLGIAYGLLGKNSLARQRFTRVYSWNSNYKKISEIMDAIETGQDYTVFFKNSVTE